MYVPRKRHWAVMESNYDKILSFLYIIKIRNKYILIFFLLIFDAKMPHAHSGHMFIVTNVIYIYVSFLGENVTVKNIESKKLKQIFIIFITIFNFYYYTWPSQKG